jgi:hypothetical protein
MNLNNLNLVELNAQEQQEVVGGSWLSRQWDAVKSYLAEAYYEYIENQSLSKE